MIVTPARLDEPQLLEHITSRLAEWKASPPAAAAARLAAGRAHPGDAGDPKARALANWLTGWRQVRDAKGLPTAGSSAPRLKGSDNTYCLRWLFWQSYLDLPHFDAILLAMADFDAHLQACPTDIPLLQLGLDVFVPLAQACGVWALRREWLETIMAGLPGHAVRYQEMKYKLGEPNLYTPQGMRARAADGPPPDQVLTQKTHKDRQQYLKALAYCEIENLLVEKYRQSGKAAPNMEPLLMVAGATLARSYRLETDEELSSRLGIRLLYPSVDDCYQALGVVHSLGRPLVGRAFARFEDNLAYPLNNGYRALSTAIQYQTRQMQSGERGFNVLVEVRILMREDHELNEQGILAWQNQQPRDPTNEWWHKLGELTNLLKQLDPRGEERNFCEFLERRPVGSKPAGKMMYVFTPRNQIILMPSGSTALDFAFELHRDIGEQMGAIKVNGVIVPISCELHNGDLVEVIKDTDPLGPDLTWLEVTASARSRRLIRQAIEKNAASVHPGRYDLVAALVKEVQYYKQQGSPLKLTLADVDAYVQRLAEKRQVGTSNEVYNRIHRDAPGYRAETHAQWIVSEQLSTFLLDPFGTRLPYAREDFWFCPYCKPIRGDRLAAYERNELDGALVRVHKKTNPPCQAGSTKGKVVPIRWAEDSETRLPYQIKIFGQDRPGLLGDALSVVYAAPNTQLGGVYAEPFPDRSGEIVLEIVTGSAGALDGVVSGLRQVAGVHQVFALMTTGRGTMPRERKINRLAFAHREVSHQIDFFGHEDAIEAVEKWLAGGLPAPWLVLHGPGRSGKSSFLNHLVQEVLPDLPPVRPVLLSFQSLGYPGEDELAELIVRKVYAALGEPIPDRAARESAFAWLDRCLSGAEKTCPVPLLIMIDEFSHLFAWRVDRRVDPKILEPLNKVLRAHSRIYWLLVMQNNYLFDDKLSAEMTVFFGNDPRLTLDNFDMDTAAKFLSELLDQAGLEVSSPGLIERICEVSDGSPYLIKEIGQSILNVVDRSDRTNIIEADYIRALDILLTPRRGEELFKHLLPAPGGRRHRVLAHLARLGSPGEWVDRSTLQKAAQMSSKDFDRAINKLHYQTILTYPNAQDKTRVRFRLPLFGIWLSRQPMPPQKK